MDMSPQLSEGHCDLDAAGVNTTRPVRLVLSLAAGEFARTVPYAAIVESWPKLKLGRQRHLFLAKFTAAERRLLSTYHAKFYSWYLITGIPRRISCSAHTLQLLQRFGEFCCCEV